MRYLPVLPAPVLWPVAGDPLVPLVSVLVEVDPDGSFCVEPVPAPVEPEVPLASRSVEGASVFESLLVPFESSPLPVWGRALF